MILIVSVSVQIAADSLGASGGTSSAAGSEAGALACRGGGKGTHAAGPALLPRLAQSESELRPLLQELEENLAAEGEEEALDPVAEAEADLVRRRARRRT